MARKWDELQLDDKKDIIKRLVIVATKILGNIGDSSMTPEDFVHDAIVKWKTGQRNWNPDKVSLFKFLAGIVSSDINHYKTSFAKRPSVSFDELEGVNPITTSVAESIANNPDKLIELSSLHSEARKSLGDTATHYSLIDIFDFMCEGYTDKEIAKKLNQPIDRIKDSKKIIRKEIDANGGDEIGFTRPHSANKIRKRG